jgi:hypothetical protein
MIKASELRIGNWLLYPHTQHEPFQIVEPRHIELAYLLKPIPLIPEILEMSGFKKEKMGKLTDQYRYSKMDGNNSFIINENILGQWVFRIWNDSNKVDFVISIINYVHQLQNLYFALRQAELTVNL